MTFSNGRVCFHKAPGPTTARGGPSQVEDESPTLLWKSLFKYVIYGLCGFVCISKLAEKNC